jgi:regulator of nucleoside diphosphate kinase
MFQSHRVITELDEARIRALDAGASLEQVFEEADIVPRARIAPDVATVNSTVSFRDERTGTVHKVTIVYPRDASVGERRISVLSPVGAALLGRKVGALASFVTPDGEVRTIRILEMHYQPEASGDPAL